MVQKRQRGVIDGKNDDGSIDAVVMHQVMNKKKTGEEGDKDFEKETMTKEIELQKVLPKLTD